MPKTRERLRQLRKGEETLDHLGRKLYSDKEFKEAELNASRKSDRVSEGSGDQKTK